MGYYAARPTAEVLVRSLYRRQLILMLLAATLLSFACGGGGSDLAPSDLDSIPTATPPAVLPEPLIFAQSEVPISGATYAVQAGDTLSAIAEQFGTTVDAIVEANDLTDATSIDIGQILIIPGATDDGTTVLGATEEPTDEPEDVDTPEPTEEPEPTDTPEPAIDDTPPACEGNVHIVEEGEFPANIAPLYGLTIEELMAANEGIDPTALHIGDCLIIPEPSTDEEP